jgi:DNA-directed RNA polymerase specialized sigma24 family protein
VGDFPSGGNRERWAASLTRGLLGVSALYAAHAVGLVRLGFVMLGDRGMAENVVQDAFLGLYRNWDRLNDPANALAYVRSSVLNGCRAALRMQARGDRRDRAAAACDGRPPFDFTEAAWSPGCYARGGRRVA